MKVKEKAELFALIMAVMLTPRYEGMQADLQISRNVL